jgi:hypothetical protein
MPGRSGQDVGNNSLRQLSGTLILFLNNAHSNSLLDIGSSLSVHRFPPESPGFPGFDYEAMVSQTGEALPAFTDGAEPL